MKKEIKIALAISAITSMYVGSTVCIKEKYDVAISNVNELNQKVEEKDSKMNFMNSKYKANIEELEKQLSETSEELRSARRKIEEYNRVTHFNPSDLTQLSNVTVAHMQRALKGTGLYNDAKYFVEAEQMYGVNAFFIAAIAAEESAWGNSNRAITQNNLTGYAVHNSASRGSYFDSRRDSILSTTQLLKEEYLTCTGNYYNGLSVVDVNKKYCFYEDQVTVDFNWSEKVSSIATSLMNKSNNFDKI